MLKTAKKGFHEGKNYEAVGRAAGLSPSAFGGATAPAAAPTISSFNAVGGDPSKLVGGGGAGGAPYKISVVGGTPPQVEPNPYTNPNFHS
jgi:hypothetical protein